MSEQSELERAFALLSDQMGRLYALVESLSARLEALEAKCSAPQPVAPPQPAPAKK